MLNKKVLVNLVVFLSRRRKIKTKKPNNKILTGEGFYLS